MRVESSATRTNYLEEYRASAQRREKGLETKSQQEESIQKIIESNQRSQAAQEPNKGFSVDKYV